MFSIFLNAWSLLMMFSSVLLIVYCCLYHIVTYLLQVI